MSSAPGLILVAEDDDNDVLLFQRAVQKARLINPVRFVRDGEEVIDYLAGKGAYVDRRRYPLPALMLLDLNMPRRTGLEVLAWVRDQPGLKRLPVVILSSSSERADVNQAYDLGANCYLVKRVELDDLFVLLRSLDMHWLILNERPDLQAPVAPDC